MPARAKSVDRLPIRLKRLWRWSPTKKLGNRWPDRASVCSSAVYSGTALAGRAGAPDGEDAGMGAGDIRCGAATGSGSLLPRAIQRDRTIGQAITPSATAAAVAPSFRGQRLVTDGGTFVANACEGTVTRAAGFPGTGMSSKSGVRSRSARTSVSTSRSIVCCFRTQPSDIALKQRLLMLRGIPPEYFAIISKARSVNKGTFDA